MRFNSFYNRDPIYKQRSIEASRKALKNRPKKVIVKMGFCQACGSEVKKETLKEVYFDEMDETLMACDVCRQ